LLTCRLVILVIALIIFGPRKLPELGRSLGKSLAEFKKASNELRNTLEEEIRIDEQRTSEEKRAAEAPQSTTAPPANPTVTHHDEEPRKMDHSA